MPFLTARLGESPARVTRLLWDTYDPSQVWMPFALAGLAAAVAMLIYNYLARGWQDVNA